MIPDFVQRPDVPRMYGEHSHVLSIFLSIP